MSKPFRFKQFQIHHDRCALKVGTDGVLLGASAYSESPNKILDIGTGSGLIALMLAQRFPAAVIEAVEIDEAAFLQAKENVAESPWVDRVHMWHMPFQEFAKRSAGKFDLIVSNPPYFLNHLPSEDPKRNIALHQDTLDFGELVDGVCKLLENHGAFWVVLPPAQMTSLGIKLRVRGLFPFQILEICDKPDKKTHRSVKGFSFQKRKTLSKKLSIKNLNGNYSEEYSKLLREFLLIF